MLAESRTLANEISPSIVGRTNNDTPYRGIFSILLGQRTRTSAAVRCFRADVRLYSQADVARGTVGEPNTGVRSHEELLASRIQMLGRKSMKEAIAYRNVAQSRFKAARKWNLEHQRTMLEEDRQPGTLMMFISSSIETSHSRNAPRSLAGSHGSGEAQSGRQLHPSRAEKRSIAFEICSYSSKAASCRDDLTFPVQAFFNIPQWWQAMGRRPIETSQEPESEDEASMDDKEGEREPGEIREVLT